MKKVELLAPAGDLERLKIAILYGANAVFCGGKQFSLRAKANNFSIDDLKEAVKFANKHKAKVHTWRIPEKTLFTVSILGGSVGTWAGMYIFRHKTKHWYFVIGMPLILIIQILIGVYLSQLVRLPLL